MVEYTKQCEVNYVVEEPPGHCSRCPRAAVERITIAVGPVEQATVLFEGAVCVEHRLEAQDDEDVHVLYDPLEDTHIPEMN